MLLNVVVGRNKPGLFLPAPTVAASGPGPCLHSPSICPPPQDKDQRSLDMDTAMSMLDLLLGRTWPLFPLFHKFLEVPPHPIPTLYAPRIHLTPFYHRLMWPLSQQAPPIAQGFLSREGPIYTSGCLECRRLLTGCPSVVLATSWRFWN